MDAYSDVYFMYHYQRRVDTVRILSYFQEEMMVQKDSILLEKTIA